MPTPGGSGGGCLAGEASRLGLAHAADDRQLVRQGCVAGDVGDRSGGPVPLVRHREDEGADTGLQAAARKLGSRRLSDVTIFTTHEPCPMCVGALLETRVRALVFAVPDERNGAAGSVANVARDAALPHQLSVVSGVRESEARRLAGEAATA